MDTDKRNPFRFPRHDAAQAMRARHMLMANVSYLTIISFVIYCSYAGLFRLSPPVTIGFAILALAINLLFYLAVCSGWNLRLTDPSMTLPQITVSTIWLMFVLFFIDQVRGAVLTLFLITFVFGIFRLRTPQFVGSAVFALIGYAGVIGLLALRYPQSTNLRIELLQWVLLAMVLPWFAVIGAYNTNIRRALRQRNLDLEKALATIKRLASHDELTGIYNRRFFLDTLHHEKSRAEREHQPFCLALLDLDLFKNVNDRYGHLVGDEVLRSFAKRVQIEIRQADYFARYGGEEFALLLVDTGLEEALTIVERIRQKIAAQSFADVAHALTVSIGVTAYCSGEATTETIGRADRALYAAKNSGRNRVEKAIYTDVLP